MINCDVESTILIFCRPEMYTVLKYQINLHIRNLFIYVKYKIIFIVDDCIMVTKEMNFLFTLHLSKMQVTSISFALFI
jgi:hypothetical protein